MRLTRRTLEQPSSPIGAHAHLLEHVPPHLPLIDLSQGAPSFAPAPVVNQRVAEVAMEPNAGRYTPLLGLASLREALAADLHKTYGGDLSAVDMCITSGANQAFAMVISALAEPGDNVVLALPYYFNHDMWLGLENIEVRYLHPRNHDVHVEDLAPLIDERTRAIVLVSPGNPTGAILPPHILDEFADAASVAGCALIVDETYRSFVPGDDPPHNLFTRPKWRENVVSLHSFSKDFAIPGYRVGAVVGDPKLLTEVAKLVDCVTICATRISQEAALAGLEHAQEWRAEKIAEIRVRQERFESVMAGRPAGFELHSAGAYYGWVGHPFAPASSNEVVERLVLEAGVLVIPGTAFMPEDPAMLRFSFANATFDQLDELADRLELLL